MSPGAEAVADAALNDCSVDSAEVQTFLLPEDRSIDGYGAMAWRPGDKVDHGGFSRAVGLAPGGVEFLQADSCHRIIVCCRRGIPAVAGLTRHETEHCAQFDRHGAALDELYEAAVSRMTEVVGDAPGGAWLYNQIPVEVDANRAGSAFARRLLGHSMVDSFLLVDPEDVACLRRQPPPRLIQNLPERMERFLSDECVSLAEGFLRGERPSPPL